MDGKYEILGPLCLFHVVGNKAKGIRPFALLPTIYINDLSDNLESNVKLFSEDTSMFLIVNEPVTSLEKLNKDIDNIGLWSS